MRRPRHGHVRQADWQRRDDGLVLCHSFTAQRGKSIGGDRTKTERRCLSLQGELSLTWIETLRGILQVGEAECVAPRDGLRS